MARPRSTIGAFLVVGILAAGCDDRQATAPAALDGSATSRPALAITVGPVVELGGLSPTLRTEAHDISEAGLVVGNSTEALGVGWQRAVTFQDGLATPLPMVPEGHGRPSGAVAVSPNGRYIVGWGFQARELYRDALLWTDGEGPIVLARLGGSFGGSYGQPSDVNDAGQIVGWSTDVAGNQHAVMWTNGGVVDLGTLGGVFSVATAVNASGQVVGSSRLADNVSMRAFLWESGVMKDLGVLPGGQSSQGIDINDRGQVVGVAGIPGVGSRLALWEGGGVRQLNDFGGISNYGSGINNLGQVVGWSATPDGVQHPFVWHDGEATLTLLEVPARFAAQRALAVSINDAGQAVGFTVGVTGQPPRPLMWTVSAPNRAPSAAIESPSGGSEGALLTFSGAGSTDPDGDALTFDWDFGDGTAHATEASPSHAYADDGTYVVTLIVSDGRGRTAATTVAVAVTNAPPAVSLSPLGPALTGDPVSLVASFGDAGVLDGDWMYSVSWGDGSPIDAGTLDAAGAIPGSHAFSSAGTFTVTVTVTDADAGSGTATTTVVVSRSNTAPVARVSGPGTAVEGAPLSFSGATSSDADGDALSYLWSWGDGSPSSAGSSAVHTFADDRSHLVTLTVTDANGATSAVTHTVTVANAPPLVSRVYLPFPVLNRPPAGASWLLEFRFEDKGVLDAAWSYSIRWGDGTAPTTGIRTSVGLVSHEHVFATPGTRTVVIGITDKDGGYGERSLSVTVVP